MNKKEKATQLIKDIATWEYKATLGLKLLRESEELYKKLERDCLELDLSGPYKLPSRLDFGVN